MIVDRWNQITLNNLLGFLMDRTSFSFSDLITGYITHFDRNEKCFGIKTSDGREYTAYLSAMTYGRISQNLEEPYIDATSRFNELLHPGQHVFAYGVFYPKGDGHKFEVKSMVFPGKKPGNIAMRNKTGGLSKCDPLPIVI